MTIPELWTYAQDTGLDLGQLHDLETLIRKLSNDPVLSDLLAVTNHGRGSMTIRLLPLSQSETQPLTEPFGADTSDSMTSLPTEPETASQRGSYASSAGSGTRSPLTKAERADIARGVERAHIDRAVGASELLGQLTDYIVDGTAIHGGIPDTISPHTLRRAIRQAEQADCMDDPEAAKRHAELQARYDALVSHAS